MQNPLLRFTALSSLLFLSACGWPVGIAAEAGGIYATRPADKPPADVADQIPPHEAWCYRTLGTVECHDTPQEGEANRLIMVDPANRYPLNARSYNAVVKQQSMPVSTLPPDMTATGAAQMDKVESKQMAPIAHAQKAGKPAAVKAPSAKAKTKKHKKHKKHKKTPDPKKDVATPPPAIEP